MNCDRGRGAPPEGDGVGARQRSRGRLVPIKIAAGRRSVLVPAFLQQLDLGFRGYGEPPQSQDGCTHGYARAALDHGTTTARTYRRSPGERDVARVANVLQDVVEPATERDQVVIDEIRGRMCDPAAMRAEFLCLGSAGEPEAARVAAFLWRRIRFCQRLRRGPGATAARGLEVQTACVLEPVRPIHTST